MSSTKNRDRCTLAPSFLYQGRGIGVEDVEVDKDRRGNAHTRITLDILKNRELEYSLHRATSEIRAT